MSINPWLAMLLVVTTLMALFAGLRFYQKHYDPHPEFVRKLLHMLMGCVTLSFPWLFQDSWPVVFLALTTIISLVILKQRNSLRAQWGDVLHGVSRNSFGELYFPASVAILFVLSDGNALLYCIPILILTLADAFAALVGVRYGQMQYKTSEGNKSLEGSLAFFTLAFLSVHIPLLLFSDVGRIESLLIGLIMGVVVMLFEAIAWRGLDNLFIPLGAFILLKTYLSMESTLLADRLWVVVALLVLFYLLRKKTTLDDSAILGAVLIGYVSWGVGGLSWLLAPCTVLAVYAYYNSQLKQSVGREHSIQAVVAVGFPGLVCLFIFEELAQPLLIYSYTLAYAVQLVIIGLARITYSQPELADKRILKRAVLQGWSYLLIPLIVMEMNFMVIVFALFAFFLLAVAGYAFMRWQPCMDDCPTDNARWWRQGTVAMTVAIVSVLPVVYIGEIAHV